MSIKKWTEERTALEQKQYDLILKAKGENRSITDEESKSIDDWHAEEQRLTQMIEVEERKEAAEAAIAEERGKMAEAQDKSEDEIRSLVNDFFRKTLMYGAEPTKEEREAYLGMKVPHSFSKDIRAAQQSTTDASGGYTIPEGFSNMLEKAELAFGSVISIADIIRTDSGNDIPWPATNDTGVVAYQVSEAGNLETSATKVTFTQPITLKAYKWTSGMVRLSFEIMQDSAFDMQQVLVDLFAERMGRGLNAAYTTGAGTTTIQGVVTGAAASGVTPLKSTITRDNILDLIHSVDPAYRASSKAYLMFNDSTLKLIKKLAIGTSDDRPLWVPSMRDGAPATIEGFPYQINQQMASTGTGGNKSMLFGDFSKYKIRLVNGDRLKILNERFADTDEVGIVLLRRTDGQVINAGTNPLKYWVHGNT